MIDGFKILENSELQKDILCYLQKGSARGEYLGFPVFNEKYTMCLPGATDWTGAGGSGKSEFLLELLINTSEFYGWKHLVYVPDVGTKEEITSILLHKLTGKTFDKRYKNNLITEEEIYKWLPWVSEHFKILYKEDKKKKITPYQFWDLFIEMHKKDKMIKTCTIDSWKDMRRYVGRDNESISRDDLYLEDVLGYRNDLLDLYDVHFHIIIHPLKTEKDKNGNRLPAGPYDLKGGPTWFDAGKCMMTVHRVDGTYNEVSVIVTKAKPGSVASLGETRFFFDMVKRRFYWSNENNDKIYAEKKYKAPNVLFNQNNFVDEEDSDVPF